MMRWDGFARSAWFAAVAALGLLPWLTVGRPLLGTQVGVRLYLVALLTAYVAGLGPRRACGIGAAVAVGFAGVGVAIMTGSIGECALGLAAILGIVRGAVLYRSRPARAVATEVVLVATGLLFARFLAGPSPIAMMLAVWGFFLVQSFFFLLGGVSVRKSSGRHPDPFEEAHRRALDLLGEKAM